MCQVLLYLTNNKSSQNCVHKMINTNVLGLNEDPRK